jgi:integrase
MGKLTQAKLPRLIEKPGRHSDGQGLFFRALGQSRAYWVYRFRSPDPETKGRERELSIGPFPEVSLIKARLKHAELRKRVVVDKADPLAEKQAAKALVAASPKTKKPTFGECADSYLDRKEERGQLGRNQAHRAQWRSTLAGLPTWFRGLPVDEIGPKQVFAALDPIWAKTPETASRLRGRIAAVLEDAREPEDVRPNPAQWTGWLKTKLGSPRELGKLDRTTGERVARSNHAAMPYKDVPAFMAKLQATPGVAAKALQFVILTGARSGEMFGMTFDEVKLDYEELVADGVRATIPAWIVPAARMKKGHKHFSETGEPHRVPLSPQAIDIFNDQLAKRSPRQEYVFESPIGVGSKVHRDGAHLPLSSMALAMTMRRLGAGEYTVHGFRTSLHKWATEIAKADLATVEKCLAHKIGTKVTQAYDRSDRFVLRQPLMVRWADYVCPAPTEAAKLVAISTAMRVKPAPIHLAKRQRRSAAAAKP